jgi:surfactin family lipopeptide synthetase A
MADTIQLSDAKRRLLEKYRRGNSGAKATSVTAIAPSPSDDGAPASLSQEQLLVRERRLEGGPALYNECIRLKMEGPLNVLILEKSFNEIIRRHEIWRTSYRIKDDRFLQVIHLPEKVELPVVDLRGLPEGQADQEIQRLAGEAVCRPFDLTQGPLFRARLFRTKDTEHLLFLSAHLSIVDGVSVYQILPFELAALYRAYSSGQASPLPALTIQFGDFAHWQRGWLEDGEAARQVAYWRKQLAGPIPVLNWPHDRERPPKQTFRGAIRSFALCHELVEALEALSRQEGGTLFMGLLAAFVSLLYCYAQQDDIIVGTPSPAGRKRSEVQKLLGYFLNPVALRFDLTGDPTFRTLLGQARQVTLEALSNDEVPLEVVAHELGANVDPSRNPFFTVAMSLQPPMPELDLPWSVTSMDIGSGGSPWDLYLAFINRPTETMVRVQYNPDLFDATTITRMIADYETLLSAMNANPAVCISQIDLAVLRESQASEALWKRRLLAALKLASRKS